MKLPLLSWTHCKFTLLSIIALVGVFIIIISFSQGKNKNRFSFLKYGKNREKQVATSRFCKQFLRKESINWNYFYYYEDIKTKRSLVWCKVPKAGSTTLTKMFLRLAGAQDTNNSTRIHKLLRKYYPRLSSKIMKQRIQTSKTFLVVRDPFERILSAFRDKLENYERDLEYRDGYYYNHYGRFMVEGSLSKSGNGSISKRRKEPTFKEFVQYLLKTSVARYDEHWMPITRLCSPCTVDFNIVIKMEHFSTEVKKPLNYAKIDVSKLGWSHKTGTNRKLINSYFSNLTFTEVKKLYTKYKKDFTLFGYTPYKYFRLFNDKSQNNSSLH